MVSVSWSISLEDKNFELSLEINPSLESGNFGRLLKMFSRNAFKVLLHQMIEMIVPVGQLYASHEVALAVSQNSSVSIETVSVLRNCN